MRTLPPGMPRLETWEPDLPFPRSTGRAGPHPDNFKGERHRGYLFYGQDRDGDENWHVCAVEIDTAEARELMPDEGVMPIPRSLSDRCPTRWMGVSRRGDGRDHAENPEHLNLYG